MQQWSGWSTGRQHAVSPRRTGFGRGLSAVALVGALGILLVATVAPQGAGAATVVAAAAPGATCSGDLGSGAPGVTGKTITVGSVSTQTGPLAGDFASMVPGVRAYFEYLDAHGGVNGRKITLAYSLDDGSNPSQFSQLTHTLIDQDHAFAAVGIASPFFAPNYYIETCTPTYVYVTSNWAGPPNLFAVGGSTLALASSRRSCLPDEAEPHPLLCNPRLRGGGGILRHLRRGQHVPLQGRLPQAYTDLNVSYGGNVTPDIQRIRSSGAQLVMTCMDVTQNVQMAQAIKEYGLKVKQYWLNGSDQDVLDQYQSVMQGVYFGVQHVPFTAPTKYYPGLATYLAAMKQYAPKYTYDELSIQGWASAALFAEGVKLAGSNLTQANVIKQTNLLTSYNAGGIYAPANWTTAHTTADPPYCEAYIQVQGNKYVSVFGKGHQVYVCFNVNKNNPVPTNTTPCPLQPAPRILTGVPVER